MLLAGIWAGPAPLAAAPAANPVADAPVSISAPARPAAAIRDECSSDDLTRIIVCGQARHDYRIETPVLEGERAISSAPARVQTRDPLSYAQCVGPNCGGDFLPLIPMALKIIGAAVDAASGNDWRQDFRTRPDAYDAYVDAKAAKSGHKVTVGVGAGMAR
jgi:hypothetical protein